MSFVPKERLIIEEAIELIKELALRVNGGDCPASHDEEFCHRVIGDCDEKADYCWHKYIERRIEIEKSN